MLLLIFLLCQMPRAYLGPHHHHHPHPDTQNVLSGWSLGPSSLGLISSPHPEHHCWINLLRHTLVVLRLCPILGFLGDSDGKVLPECRRPGFDPWIGKIPWRRKWKPTPVFLPGEFHGQRNLVGYSPWGHKESDTTE